ncbi:XK-related protein 8-like [Polymixia lowei]
MDVSMRSFFTRMQDPQGVAVYLTHDLSMLRLIETFAESAPQLVLMLTIMLQEGSVDPITVLKAAGSALAIACSITMYHRSLRSFLLDKDQQKPFSSVVYWIWNVLLISPRVVAIALFATVLPCYIIAHFLSSWMILLICAWRAKTTFMDSACGERLYRATVALIWYFSWFNVAEGQTKYRSLLYNLYVMLDLVLLFGLSSWWIYRDPTRFKLPLASAVIISTASILGYILGLILKVIYYKFFHPKIARHQHTESGREGSPDVQERTCFRSMEDEVDLTLVTDGVDAEIMGHSVPDPPKPVLIKENKRMRKLAENFYS